MEFLAPIAFIYRPLYLMVVLLMTINKYGTIKRTPMYAVLQKRDVYEPIMVFMIFFVLFYGLRPTEDVFEYFGDTGVYADMYYYVQQFGVFSSKGEEELNDVLFGNLMFFCAQLMDVHIFFLLCLILYIVPIYAGCRKLDVRHGATLMLFCIGAFSFYGYAINGVRNGIACSLCILALAYLCKGGKIPAILLSIMAIAFHKSAILPAATMFFTYFVRKPKLMFYAWLGAIAVSLVLGGYIDNILSIISYDQRLAENIQGDHADLEHRFRWDFLLYSSMPIVLGYYTVFKRKLHDKAYLLLLGTYIYANLFWVLAIRAIFSNRIAYLSWFIYPIVLAYPLLKFPVFKKNHSRKTAWILLAHFGFTTVLWLLGK